MRSHSFGVRLPQPVRDLAFSRSKHEGYRSVGEYVTNLIRRDGLSKPDHELMVWIAGLSRRAQDYIDDRLAGFPAASVQTQPNLTGHFCTGLIAVEMEGGRKREAAIAKMPAELAQLCTAWENRAESPQLVNVLLLNPREEAA